MKQVNVKTIYSMDQVTHHNDHKVQPAPGVSEVFDEAQSQPFDAHLQKEGDGKDPVHVVEDILKYRPVGKVDILKGLKEQTHVHSI